MIPRIRRVWAKFSHPLDRLWKWAKAAPKPKGKAKRFGALRRWADHKVTWFREHGTPKEVRTWFERRRIYRKKQKFFKKRAEPKPEPTTGVVTPDRSWNPNRKPIAAWMVPWMDKSWNAGWRGILVSGWRSPEFSEQLCFAMCGAPSCPGRCAGKTSNHTKHVNPDGAVDVSDYTRFGQVQKQIGSGLWNALGAADPVHFSKSGR